MGDKAPNTDRDVLCQFCDAKARYDNASNQKRTVPKANESVLLAFFIVNQSLECCARCEASLRRAIKSAPADTRDDDVGEEGGTRRAAAAVDAEAAANSAQPSADSGEGSFQANRYPSAKRTLKRWRDLLPTQQQGATKGTIRNLVLGLLKVQENKETANEGKERMVRFTAVTVPSHFAPTSVGRLSTGQNRDGADGVHYETGEG